MRPWKKAPSLLLAAGFLLTGGCAGTLEGETTTESDTAIAVLPQTTTAAATEPESVTAVTTAPETQVPAPEPIAYPAPTQGEIARIQAAIAAERALYGSDEAVLTFAGDCTLATFPECPEHLNFNSIYMASGSLTYPFDYAKYWFQNDDYTIVNLENAFTTATEAEVKEWRFKGDPSYAGILSPSGIEGVTLENNHARDYFEIGFQDTQNALKQHGIAYAYDGVPMRFTVKGIDFVLLNYDCRTWRQERIGDQLIAQYCADIQKVKTETNIVLVSMHWGVEYYNNPEPYQKDYARRMIDAGADLIVGAHPHQLQGIEQYNGKYIVYSLGNFAFGGNENAVKAARDTMIVRPRFKKDSAGKPYCSGMTIVPFAESSAPDAAVNNYRPIPLYGEDAARVKRTLISRSAPLPNGISDPACGGVDF